MFSGETSWGGARREFPATTMGLVGALHGDREEHRLGLEELVRRYWKPLYAYLRIARSKSNEEAKDYVQDFLLSMLETEALRAYRPEKGSFRLFLKVLLRRYVAHRVRDGARLKRGGGVSWIPLDDPEFQKLGTLQNQNPEDPEHAFDRLWNRSIVEQAIARVKQRHVGEDLERRFRIFEEYAQAEPEQRPTYGALAQQYGVSESDVRNWLHAVRAEIRESIREEIAATSGGDEELKEEWRVLLGTE